MIRKFIFIGMVLLLWFSLMQGMAAGQDTKAERKKATASNVTATNKSQKAQCKKVSMLIKNKTIEKYALDSINVPNEPRTDEYLNLDIDGDGIPDKVIRSCGTGECGLYITLSSGGSIEFGTSPFFLIRIGGKVYVLVAQEQEYSKPKPKPKPVFSLHLIDKKGVPEVCNTYERRQ